ncbi:MAG: hypothetical protein ACPKQO_06340 [Nitrososphaeraceae archaeon]
MAYDFISIVIAVIAIIISIITFAKRKKSDQFKIALDINNKLEKNIDEFSKSDFSPENSDELSNDDPSQRSKAIQLLSTIEFLSFTINHKEITNKNIIQYFKSPLINESKKIFQKYPDFEENKELYQETKKILRKIDKKKKKTIKIKKTKERVEENNNKKFTESEEFR